MTVDYKVPLWWYEKNRKGFYHPRGTQKSIPYTLDCTNDRGLWDKPDDSLVEVFGEFAKETEKAICLKVDATTIGDNYMKTFIWLPKSIIKG